MTDTIAFQSAIKRRGHTLYSLAKETGIPVLSLESKSHNVTDFLIDEIEIICEVLQIRTTAERLHIFFAFV